MSKPPVVYRKIPGRSFTWRGHGSVWLGDDHLLEATSVIIIEHYRRFFFHDIRAFVLQRTNARSKLGWIFGGVSALFALIALSAWWFGMNNAKEEWHPMFYVVAVLFGGPSVILSVLLLINLLRGPTCRCHLLTSTGWKVLSAPTRLGAASRMEAQLIAQIQAVQGPTSVPEAPTP